MRCRFTSEGPAPSEDYSGKMTTVGLDLGFTAGGALTWGVYAPTKNMVPGSLSGNYAGASGSVSVGVGIGENFLLGGSGNSVALQPWSVEGTTGVNASLGLSSMELRPAYSDNTSFNQNEMKLGNRSGMMHKDLILAATALVIASSNVQAQVPLSAYVTPMDLSTFRL